MASWSQIARRIRVPLGFVFAALYLWLAHPRISSLLAGLLFIVAGLLIRAAASGCLQKNEQLAVSGPYAYTRNPLYLGSLIIAIGFAFAARNLWIVVILLLMFFAIYLPVIRSEEEFLASKFPAFQAYAREVPRLFPRLHAPGSDAQFSWDLYWKHREYNATLGSIAILAALGLKLRFFS